LVSKPEEKSQVNPTIEADIQIKPTIEKDLHLKIAEVANVGPHGLRITTLLPDKTLLSSNVMFSPLLSLNDFQGLDDKFKELIFPNNEPN
jgi:hypothetical protein